MTATAHELFTKHTLADLLELRELVWNDIDERGHLRDPQALMAVGTAINWRRAAERYGPVEPMPISGMPQITAGICPCCKRHSKTIARRRRHCNYSGGDSSKANWLTSCATCFNEDCAQWAEQDADYRWDKL